MDWFNKILILEITFLFNFIVGTYVKEYEMRTILKKKVLFES
jgi:hypothetical protein